MPGLHTEVVGTGRPDFAFLHGLFGRGRNWTGIAQGLAAQGHTSVLFDLPNHGASGWTGEFSYPQMAEAVGDELRLRLGSAARLNVVGHSMGGKVAMLLALSRPELVSGLAVVDIAPAVSEGVDGFGPLIEALRSVDLAGLTSRGQAEATLKPLIPDPGVRQFLLQNLRVRRHPGHPGASQWYWQPNLDLLEASLDRVAGWPDPGTAVYPGPVWWLAGELSDYVAQRYVPAMRALFPELHQVVIPGAGHWVHADNPQAVIDALADLAASAQLRG
ncbi:MAG: alpha/beta fold hydrolase [Propionicimonas sp.]|nr:alpha/beta fold hydrolase [Propionicimonas sp.]